MKRVVSIFLILLLLSVPACNRSQTAEGSEANDPSGSFDLHPVELGFDVPEIAGYDDFVYTLSAALMDGTGNRNLSPLSVYIALAMAAEGASGQTQADILDLLGCDSLDELHTFTGEIQKQFSRKAYSGEVAVCNSLWMTDEFPLREAYQNRLKEYYGADAQTVDFRSDQAEKRIAEWIREKTNGLIDPSPEAMDYGEDTLAVLINTLYFRDEWQVPFRKRNIQSGTFTGTDGAERTVDYLHRYDDCTYVYRGDGFLRYSLDLCSRGRVVFVLPDEGVALSDLLGTPSKLKTLLSGGEWFWAKVDLLLPKFAFSDRYDLGDMLCALGLTDAFRKGADFSGMTDGSARLDRVIQETVIDLNEGGVEAASYTDVDLSPEALPPEEELPLIRFHLTRPFLFAIESKDRTVLFVGTVTAPTEHS